MRERERERERKGERECVCLCVRESAREKVCLFAIGLCKETFKDTCNLVSRAGDTSKNNYKRDLQKRPTKETNKQRRPKNKRDHKNRLTKETYKTDPNTRGTEQNRLTKVTFKDTCNLVPRAGDMSKENCKRDLQKRPTKETYKQRRPQNKRDQ